MPSSTIPSPPIRHFDSISDTLAAFQSGEFIVVLDDESRENEGDLIIAAEDITPAKMAFMVRYSSGLICAPITSTLASSLQLPQMVNENTDPKRTAYTVSIDAESPLLSTGISAHDRALTCKVLASPTAMPTSFRRPGHVFPLQAREGGVVERPGHTEATVEFCRLAGKVPAGVICELVEDGVEVEGVAERGDSGMMRRDACLKFGKRWGLKCCTIADLVEYVKAERKGENGGKGAVTNGFH